MPSTLQRAYDSYRTGEAVLRDVGRFRQIVGVLARHGFGWVVQRLSLRDEWILKKLAELATDEEVDLPLERRVLLAIHELGPTFVKLGQILSTRRDLLPPLLIAELETLQDAVPPMPLATVRETIQRELNAEVEAIFDEFDPVPLACASIAQVHCARLKGSGEEVVIKVQRPNLRGQIEADLEIMMFLAKALEANFPDAQLYSPVAIVGEFERGIRREIDFNHEVEHIERFRRNFEGHPSVHFPTPYKQRCTARVMTMERIRGTKITDIDRGHWDVDRVVRHGLDAILQMICVDGFFHGDLHPGNLLVRDDGTLCFIDFGLVGHLNGRQRDQLIDMLMAVARHDFSEVARCFWKIGLHGRESTRDYGRFESDVSGRLEARFGGKRMNEIDFGALFMDIVDLSLTHRIRMPPDYTMTFKAILTMEGVAKQLIPDMDLLDVVRPYTTTLLAQRYNPRRLLQGAYDAVRDLGDTLGMLPESSRAILEDLQAGRAVLNVEVQRLNELRSIYVQVQHRNMLGWLTAAAAVCGTLALGYRDLTLFGFPAVSFCFYVASGVLYLRYTRAEP